MIDINCWRYHPRNTLRPVLALSACVLLLCTTPAGARLSGAIGVAGAGHALKETLAETTGLFGEMVDAFIDGDAETVSELMGEVAKTPGKLVQRAFPVLEAPQVIADRLESAKRKVARFVGGVGEGLTDARAALAVGRDGPAAGWRDATLLDGDPLPATAFTAPEYNSPAEVLAALTGGAQRTPGEAGAEPAASAWDFEQWVIARQEANPYCYGVVDPETLPADCFAPSDIERPTVPLGPDNEYATALTDVLGEDSAVSADADDYLAALSDLEEKEEEQRRLEAEERQRQARLKAEARERRARLEAEEERGRLARREEQRRLDERERQRQQEYDLEEQRQQAEYRRQALQNLNESLRGFVDQVNRAYGLGGTTGGSGTTTGGADDCTDKERIEHKERGWWWSACY